MHSQLDYGNKPQEEARHHQSRGDVDISPIWTDFALDGCPMNSLLFAAGHYRQRPIDYMLSLENPHNNVSSG